MMTFAERHMLSQQQQQLTVVVDAGTVTTDDVREAACNHRARPIITRTVATPLATPRGSPAAAAAASGGDDVIGDVMARDASSESFVTSLSGYSDTHIYEASHLPCVSRPLRSPALINYLFGRDQFCFTIRPTCPKAV